MAMNLNVDVKVGTATSAVTASGIYLYLVVSAVASALLISSFLVWGLKGHDHFASASLNGDTAFYRDFAGRKVPEIQDQELFYHNIGDSVAEARKADIIFLGPSFASYALDKTLLRQFEAAHGGHLYNMSFIGIRGGEFSRRIITQWGIRAPLWVINADDQFIQFFSTALDLTLGPATMVIPATCHNRLRGFLSAAARNLRWRAEDYISHYTTGDGSAQGIYRNIATGDATIEVNPRYMADDNKEISFDRGRECHASPETIEIARQYLKDIGGRAVLTLVPHSQYCPAQAYELAKALGIEIIIPPDAGYTTIDGGGHLDRKSAISFTNFLMTELVKTEAYSESFKGDGR
jgi:hypothetical protein